ncbi:MAG TPA: maleylpyruvate isomerase family mycothiol-dependent enzyme [Mycobacteriales bacterium]|nr:maleylpyruvate isomerase family mycothiol-dependent enzyme [Mycobacteriales bacterium]
MDHLALLEGEVVAMAAALRAADPTRDVASCPGWTVQDLTNHITAVHRWVLGALRNEGSPPYDDSVVSTADDYAAAATALVTRLRELPEDAPCWTFNRDDQTAGFWRRRQLQEVSIHRWDVEQHEIDEAVAEAGVDEVVSFFLPRQVRSGRTTLPAGHVGLDTGRAMWTLVDGDGPRAFLHAGAPDLNLLLWGRRTLDEVVVEGDAAFAAAVFAAALTP